ncbi:MAG: dephospho-CoA kinase [Planctomycetes bacterium]|nr:dephospho-CoA kinase [Planctomycetota bacterium]MCD7895471.1 dephospho-CoA kinase [Planctomycetaceae bacterium]
MTCPVYGVTGLPCSGKSYAAALLADGRVDGVRGVLVKADDVGHDVLTRPDVVLALRQRFGDDAFRDTDAAAVRRAIAERVFSDRDELAWLERLVHPLVTAEADAVIARNTPERPVVMEAALLFEAGMDDRSDVILLVEASFETRLRRAERRGWDRTELERRERRQIPLFEAALQGRNRGKIIRVRNDADDDGLAGRIRDALARYHNGVGESP